MCIYLYFYCTHISLFDSYLFVSGNTCNPWRKSATGTQVSILVGALFTIMAVVYATIRTAQQIGQQEADHKTGDEETQPLTKGEESVNKEKKEEEEKVRVTTTTSTSSSLS